MKIFSYDFYISYGSGQGIVFAKNRYEAIQLVKKTIFYNEESITLTEIIPKIGNTLDFSYKE